ncbi:MAG: response regulator [Anaerolineales bacterium]
MYRILFGDDDTDIQILVRNLLEKESYQVSIASNGQEVFDIWRKEYFDCLILDVMMPLMDGLTVCQRIRRVSNVPIILLTAIGEEEAVVKGLECGADDYIQKPFRLKEFLARLRVVMRRAEQLNYPEKKPIVFDGLTLEPQTRKLIKKDQVIEVTPLEYQLLAYLMRHPGKLFSKDELLQDVWGYPSSRNSMEGELNLIEAAIRRLRKKVEDDPAQPRIIQTVWGSGYRFGS